MHLEVDTGSTTIFIRNNIYKILFDRVMYIIVDVVLQTY